MTNKEAFEAGRAEAVHKDRFCGRELVLPFDPVAREYFIMGFLQYSGRQAEVNRAKVAAE